MSVLSFFVKSNRTQDGRIKLILFCNILSFSYRQELLKVLYVDPELTYLKDLDLAAAGSTDKSDASYDGRNGVRSIRVAPDGKHLASGDR